jgi:hypothetical protein
MDKGQRMFLPRSGPWHAIAAGLCGAALVVTLGGCCDTTPPAVTSPYQPGPQAGRAVGSVAGTVAGNVAGAAVGVVEGTAAGVSKSFDTTVRVVRQWRTETTADGRTIQVPIEVLVDEKGRVVGSPPSGATK